MKACAQLYKKEKKNPETSQLFEILTFQAVMQYMYFKCGLIFFFIHVMFPLKTSTKNIILVSKPNMVGLSDLCVMSYLVFISYAVLYCCLLSEMVQY